MFSNNLNFVLYSTKMVVKYCVWLIFSSAIFQSPRFPNPQPPRISVFDFVLARCAHESRHTLTLQPTAAVIFPHTAQKRQRNKTFSFAESASIRNKNNYIIINLAIIGPTDLFLVNSNPINQINQQLNQSIHHDDQDDEYIQQSRDGTVSGRSHLLAE